MDSRHFYPKNSVDEEPLLPPPKWRRRQPTPTVPSGVCFPPINALPSQPIRSAVRRLAVTWSKSGRAWEDIQCLDQEPASLSCSADRGRGKASAWDSGLHGFLVCAVVEMGPRSNSDLETGSSLIRPRPRPCAFTLQDPTQNVPSSPTGFDPL